MKTISIEEFKNLSTERSLDLATPGKLAISKKSQEKLCKTVKVGDTVFFLETKGYEICEDGTPRVDVTIVQAEVVE